jgi:Tol biopolymer transport system component
MSRALLVVVGLALIGATAAARTGEDAARPRTLAKVRGSVDALAQDGRRIAWIDIHARCGKQVQILTLPRRRPVYVGFGRTRSCVLGGRIVHQAGPIALSGDGRVLWQGVVGHGNTEIDIDLVTASLRHPRTRVVAALGISYSPGDPDDYLEAEDISVPTAADGNAILFYALCETGCGPGHLLLRPAVYRLVGHRPRRLARIRSPVGLSVRGRRFAVVTNSFRCCNLTPVWSHDGTRFAWIYHGNLWTIRADGTGDRQIATGVPGLRSDEARPPSWSPDDARLVFERTGAQGKHGVCRVDATGTGLKRLTSGMSPAWSPDGTKIAFVRGKDVYVVAPDGTGETKLTTTERPTAGPLSWSPDSTRIAVSRGGDIYSVRADGTGETRLTMSPHAEDQPAWSPSGAKIAYVDESNVDESSPSPGIKVVNTDGSGATRLTSPTATYLSDGSPAWSPDSSRLAFTRDAALWLVNADGSGVRRVADGEYASPQWSHGSSIAVGDETRAPVPWDPGIRLVSPADGKATKIAPVAHSRVEIHDDVTGRLIDRFTIDGYARTIGLGSDYVALLVNHESHLRVELYNLNGSFRSAADVPSSVGSLSAAGRNVVFATGRVIRRLDAMTGVVSTLATAPRTPVGLTIEGRRVVWAENVRGAAQILAVAAP